MEAKKPKGECSYCKSTMQPKVLESAALKRDICICTANGCGQRIICCRMPGCDNYARCGTYWDDELCHSCTKKTMNGTTRLGYTSIALAVTFAIKHKLKGHFGT